MPTPDLINGLFEAGGALAVLVSIRQLLKDRCSAGIASVQLAFFQFWGLWNLFYYPHLDQLASFIGGILLVSANTVYLALLLIFPKAPSRQE